MSCLVYLAIATVALGLLLPRAWSWLQTFLALSSLPTPPGTWLLGHLKYISLHNHHQVLTRWAAELGGLYRIRLGFIQVSPACVGTVLERSPRQGASCQVLIGLK